MEKELLDTFETAKKSAEAASAGGGPAEVDRCVDALRQLRRIPVTKKALVDTQIGKSLRSLRKHSEEKIQSLASDLFEHWKKVVVEETSKDTKKNQASEDKKPMKVQVKTERSETIKVEKVSKSLSVKVEKINSNGGLKAEKVSYSQSVKIEKSESLPTKKLPPSVIAPPKLSSMLKCNDPVRDKVRELLAEALSRVPKETRESDVQEVRNILDEVDVSDPIRVAVTVESALFERLGSSKGEHNVKYRSIMFNLKDSKNPDFRRRVLLGEVKPAEISDLMPDDMASDERKAANRQIKEKAMFECERAGAPKASTDQFKCGRCGQRKCTYYQLQTRSADEPMTTFVTCVNCNNHWKFC